MNITRKLKKTEIQNTGIADIIDIADIVR